jgi:hypothetical protein
MSLKRGTGGRLRQRDLRDHTLYLNAQPISGVGRGMRASSSSAQRHAFDGAGWRGVWEASHAEGVEQAEEACEDGYQQGHLERALACGSLAQLRNTGRSPSPAWQSEDAREPPGRCEGRFVTPGLAPAAVRRRQAAPTICADPSPIRRTAGVADGVGVSRAPPRVAWRSSPRPSLFLFPARR